MPIAIFALLVGFSVFDSADVIAAETDDDADPNDDQPAILADVLGDLVSGEDRNDLQETPIVLDLNDIENEDATLLDDMEDPTPIVDGNVAVEE